MKKLLPFLLTVILVLSLAGIAFAKEDMNEDAPDRVVGDDIEIGEGEFKIVSIQDPEDDRVVGDDIEVGEGEFKIISIQDPEDDRVVGDDIEIGDDQAKIISIDEEEENDRNNIPVVAGASLVVLVAAGVVYFLKKK